MERFRRFTNAFRRHWVRITVGAISGLSVVCWYLVMGVVALEQNQVTYDDYSAARFAFALILFAVPAGALLGYSMRGEKTQ